MNEEAFTAFFHDVFPRLMRYLARLTDVQTAEEICLDVFTTIWRRQQFKSEDDYDLARLRRDAYILAKGSLSNFRRHDRRQTRLLAKVSRTLVLDVPFVERDLIARDNSADLLAALSEDERLLVLLIAEGYRQEEISEMLGVSAAAVKMRLYRLRKRVLRERTMRT